MWVSPVKPKCPIRIPVKSTKVTPSDIPKILTLPSSTPTDITNAYKHTIWATELGSHNKFSNQFIDTFVYYSYLVVEFSCKGSYSMGGGKRFIVVFLLVFLIRLFMQQCHIRFISETYQLCKFSVIMVGADTEQAWGRYVPNMVLIWRAWSSEPEKTGNILSLCQSICEFYLKKTCYYNLLFIFAYPISCKWDDEGITNNLFNY